MLVEHPEVKSGTLAKFIDWHRTKGRSTQFLEPHLEDWFKELGLADSKLLRDFRTLWPSLDKQQREAYLKRLLKLIDDSPNAQSFFAPGAEPGPEIQRALAAGLSPPDAVQFGQQWRALTPDEKLAFLLATTEDEMPGIMKTASQLQPERALVDTRVADEGHEFETIYRKGWLPWSKPVPQGLIVDKNLVAATQVKANAHTDESYVNEITKRVNSIRHWSYEDFVYLFDGHPKLRSALDRQSERIDWKNGQSRAYGGVTKSRALIMNSIEHMEAPLDEKQTSHVLRMLFDEPYSDHVEIRKSRRGWIHTRRQASIGILQEFYTRLKAKFPDVYPEDVDHYVDAAMRNGFVPK